MEVENTIISPRMRLQELKSSADFPSNEFKHNIKTWVNMASLLVKQGNMAESSDEENAYISYVRACLIITKIIPHQEQYPAMMNDIACIDLRQKILGIIPRMGHLERRLLKRFDQENQKHSATTPVGSCAKSTLSRSTTLCSKFPSSIAAMRQRCEPSIRVDHVDDIENNNDIDDDDDDDNNDDDDDDGGIRSNKMLSFIQIGDEDYDEKEKVDVDEINVDVEGAVEELRVPQRKEQDVDGEEEEEDLAKDFIEMKYEFAPSDELSLELDPKAYIHHRRRAPTSNSSSRSTSPEDSQEKEQKLLQDKGTVPTLKKKSSNDPERSSLLLSPECQPNLTNAMPSALFARQREGGHVRRCSSNDVIRHSIHLHSGMGILDNINAGGANPSPRLSVHGSTVSLRGADKRYSMAIIGTGEVERRDRKDRVPDYRGIASSIDVGEEERAKFARDILKSRFTNRRTMSFESSYFDESRTKSDEPIDSYPYGAVSSSSLKKSHSISAKSSREVLPAPRLSVDGVNAVNGASSTTLSNTNTTQQSSGVINRSIPSSTSSTPFTSPLMRSTSPHMSSGMFVGHGYSQSLASITSGSTIVMSETSANGSSTRLPTGFSNSTVQNPQGQSSNVSCSTSYTNCSTVTSGSTMTVSSTSSPTLLSMASWATVTTGKKVGLLRKIRSKPKVKDQLFDIVAAPTPTSSPPPQMIQQQQQQQQQPQLMSMVSKHSRQQSNPMPLRSRIVA
ncbi:hypothetical protein BGZ76_007200 [Entomortierella beljakovae]|nr:hypothetical protein BGZ76_007200 [Entomortierella beljakovae]